MTFPPGVVESGITCASDRSGTTCAAGLRVRVKVRVRGFKPKCTPVQAISVKGRCQRYGRQTRPPPPKGRSGFPTAPSPSSVRPFPPEMGSRASHLLQAIAASHALQAVAAPHMLQSVASLHSQILSVLSTGPLSGHRWADEAPNRHHMCVYILFNESTVYSVGAWSLRYNSGITN